MVLKFFSHFEISFQLGSKRGLKLKIGPKDKSDFTDNFYVKVTSHIRFNKQRGFNSYVSHKLVGRGGPPSFFFSFGDGPL